MSYASTPLDTDRMPRGIPYIVANEAAERFSYYGMRAILVVYMTQYLHDANGKLAPMSDVDARSYFHLFSFATYFLPLIGALVADFVWGKYRTILRLSIVYCLGHLALALGDSGAVVGLSPRAWLAIGLGLIALGSGGIKPCVSAHVGDQFGASNRHLMDRVYSWFYFSINFGAVFSQALIPYLLQQFGPSVAFGLPGVLMALATLTFWAGRHRFIHVPPAGIAGMRAAFTAENLKQLGRLVGLYVFIAFFWSLYDQTASSWVIQAKRLDTTVGPFTVLPAQIQAVNPLLILALIPVFSYGVYPALSRVFPLTSLRKIALGMFLMVPAFLVSAYIEYRLDAGDHLGMVWQVFAYLVLTSAEVMVSITCLEFSYSQAPRGLKSIVMSLYLSSVAAGNLFTALVNYLIRDDQGGSRLSELQYYLLFAAVMALAAIGFTFVSRRFPTPKPA